MKVIQFTKNLPGGYSEGQVLAVDENSAKELIKRGDAKEYTETDAPAADVPLSSSTNLQVAQVAAADMPLEQPKRSDKKADLVAYAAGRLHGDDGEPLTTEQLEALTKDELADQLGIE